MPGSEIASSSWFSRFTRNLRFPQLFLLVVALFVLDLIIPDVIPFVDEAILGVLALILANVKQRTKSARKSKLDAEGQ